MKSATSGNLTSGKHERLSSAGPFIFLSSLASFASDIKLAHSIFALPFAASAVVLAKLPPPTFSQIILLLVCMVGARSFAMGMNRYLDRHFDKVNPRTANRMIPAGRLMSHHGLVWSVTFGILFFAAALGLNILSGLLSIPILLILSTYSLMKRISWLTHWYLGICLGLAPVAVAVALTGTAPAEIIALGLAIAFWTAGFDILYSLQDRQFDLECNLQSVPARFGVRKALEFSRLSFVSMIALLLIAGYLAPSVGFIYYTGVTFIGAILAYEHLLIREVLVSGDVKHINAAFFTANAWISVIFFAVTLADALIGG